MNTQAQQATLKTDALASGQTMAALFRHTSQTHAEREALFADNARLSYGELDQRTDQLAAALSAIGIGQESIIATLLLDGVAMVELSIASAKIGATLLAMNWRLAPQELNYILGDATPDICFVSECFETLFTDAGGQPPRLVKSGDPGGCFSALAIDAASVSTGAIAEIKGRELNADNRWYMLYTSGTTGRPKGCQHSQGSYAVNVHGWLSRLGVDEHDCLMSLSPLFHVHGFGTLLCALVAGAKVVIPPRDIDAESLVQLTADEAVSFQPLWQNIEDIIAAQIKLQLSIKFKCLIAAGGSLPPELIQQLTASPDIDDMKFIYGQSEAGCWVSMLNAEEQIARPLSCGKVMPQFTTRIVDEQGQTVAPGEIGELLVKGDGITMGYHKLPEATAETIVDGWLHTGDLFREDEEGYLYLSGRKKELIKTGGENVYPAEVDSVLLSHPEILDACVAGVADKKWGEAVKAFVVLAPGSTLTPKAISDWVRQHIASYKRPRYVQFVDEIPRDFSMKIQRLALAKLETTQDQAVD